MQLCVYIRAYSDRSALGNTGAASFADRSRCECADCCALHACAEQYTYRTADGHASVCAHSNRAHDARTGAAQLPDWDAR